MDQDQIMAADQLTLHRDPQPDDNSANLREMLAILRKRALAIGIATALTTSLGLAYIAVTPAIYTATISILIDATARAPLGAEPTAVFANTPDTALVESQVRLLGSQTVQARVIKGQHLDGDDDYTNKPGVIGTILQIFGPRAASSASGLRPAQVALATFAKTVTVKRSERTYVIDVDVGARSPDKAARLANALGEAYIADREAAKDKIIQSDAKALGLRLAALQSQLGSAETAFETYRQAHQIYDANGKRVSEIDLADSSTLLSKARVATAEAKARYDEVHAILATGRPADAVSEAIKSPLIDKLRSQYADIARQMATYQTTLGDRNPALIETRNQMRAIENLISRELQRVAANAASDYKVARASEAAVQAQINHLKSATDTSALASAQLRSLKNDVDAKRAVYEKFLKARDSMTQAPIDGQFARIITPAVAPTFASAPRRALILALGLVSGLFAGMAYALLAEHLGFSRAPHSALPQPVAPRMEAEDKPATAPALTNAAPVSEMTRFYQSLTQDFDRLDTDGSMPLTFAVVALARHNGGATTAISLAKAAQAEGSRVLIIEAAEPSAALLAKLDRSDVALIDLLGTMRPCYALRDAPAIAVVPASENEGMLVRRLLRNPAIVTITGIGGHFDVVIMHAGWIGAANIVLEAVQAADRVVFDTLAPAPGAAQISRALRLLGVSPEKFGGLWMLDAAGAVAA